MFSGGGAGLLSSPFKFLHHNINAFNITSDVTGVTHCNLFRKKAFTLAEVLITLGIIGIVAAMTMPSLIAKYQKQQTLTQLKKAYSEINQAIRISESSYGTLDSWDFRNIDDADERDIYFGENYMFPNIKTVKKCLPSSSECWTDKIYTIKGTETSINVKGMSFLTSSGYSVYYWLHRTGNGGWFYIDINGPKKPNTIGKDIFPFLMSWGDAGRPTATECIKKLGFFPKGLDCHPAPSREALMSGIGSNIDVPSFACETGTGGYCGAVIMIDGWTLKKDYPW